MQEQKKILKELLNGNKRLKMAPASLSLGTSDLSPSLVKRGGLQSLPKKKAEFSYNIPNEVPKFPRMAGPLFAGAKRA